MNVIPTTLPDTALIESPVNRDVHGFLGECFSEKRFLETRAVERLPAGPSCAFREEA
jgi:dTDP-4-dehydrorhamnose 3,5-epimerase-like enzyme